MLVFVGRKLLLEPFVGPHGGSEWSCGGGGHDVVGHDAQFRQASGHDVVVGVFIDHACAEEFAHLVGDASASVGADALDLRQGYGEILDDLGRCDVVAAIYGDEVAVNRVACGLDAERVEVDGYVERGSEQRVVPRPVFFVEICGGGGARQEVDGDKGADQVDQRAHVEKWLQ